jgi:hypothetical protein
MKKKATKPRKKAIKSKAKTGAPTHGLEWLEGHLNKSGRTLKKKKG